MVIYPRSWCIGANAKDVAHSCGHFRGRRTSLRRLGLGKRARHSCGGTHESLFLLIQRHGSQRRAWISRVFHVNSSVQTSSWDVDTSFMYSKPWNMAESHTRRYLWGFKFLRLCRRQAALFDIAQGSYLLSSLRAELHNALIKCRLFFYDKKPKCP